MTHAAEIQVIYKHKVDLDSQPKIISAKSAYKVLLELYDDNTLDHSETAIALFLNRANRVLGWKLISHGGITGTVIDPKVVFQTALALNASGIVISHNHPSGNLRPSDSDRSLTTKLKDAGKFLDLPLIDHIIVTREGYYSFADHGLI